MADAASKAVDRAKELADKVLSTRPYAPRSRVPDYLGLFLAGAGRAGGGVPGAEGGPLRGDGPGGRVRDDGGPGGRGGDAPRYPSPRSTAEAADEPEALRKALFPAPRPGPFGVLRDLHALTVLLAEVQTATVVLIQVAQGLRDAAMLDACLLADEHVKRQLAWVQNHIKHRAVQTLTVPA